jgi:hypothetical protein
MASIADLEMAHRHVQEGRRRVADQRDRITELRRAGRHNTALAEEFLAQMIQRLATTEQHRDEIAEALDRRAKSGGARPLG